MIKLNIPELDDEKIIEILERSLIYFKDSRFDLESSALIVKHIINLTRTGIISNHIDYDNITKMIEALQESIYTEFAKNGPYEKSVLDKVKNNFRKCLSDYHKDTLEIFHSRTESLEHRVSFYQNIEDLTRLVLREPKSPGKRDEEKRRRVVGLSYAYASLINSIFGPSLLDCYIWDRIASGKKVILKDIERKEVSDIYNHYKQVSDLSYFDGYDVTIKNSVENSNFHYDSNSGKITFVDEYCVLSKQTGKTEMEKNTLTYSLEELVEKYEKIEMIYKLVLLFNQILVIYSACNVLSDRYH